MPTPQGPGWQAEALWLALEPRLSPTRPGFSVEVLPKIDSTNTELMRRARAGRTEPVLLVAESQTAGRGRLGRRWVSTPTPTPDLPGAIYSIANNTILTGAESAFDSNALPALTFSLGLPIARGDWSGLSLAVGVALVQALRAQLPTRVANDLGLKWPNDLWWRGRKLAGILIESSGTTPDQPRYGVIGVGLNLDAPVLPDDARPPGSMPPVGLRDVAGAAASVPSPTITAPQVLTWVAPALVDAVLRFEREGFEPFQREYAAVDVLHGQPVTLDPPVSGQARGIARGPDATGALRVVSADGVIAVGSGEVRVRPMGP